MTANARRLILRLMLAGSVVQPDEPTCRIPNIPVFKVGFWNGLYHSPAMVKELADNFRTFSFWQPYGSINHNDNLACGRISNVRFDGQTLFADVSNLPESVAKAWNAGFLHGPSIEYWDTRENAQHKLTSGFRLRDGRPPGLVLRCVTLCGNGAPAVKTLGPMPKAVYEGRTATVAPASQRFDNWKSFGNFGKAFSNIDPATRRFSSEDFMDKAAMIASLKAAQPWLTDDLLNTLNEQQLAMMLDGAQGASAAGSVADATPDADDAGGLGGGAPGGAMPGGAVDAAAGPPLDTTKMMADCGNDPQKMMDAARKFMEQSAKVYDATAAKARGIVTLEAKLKMIEADTSKKAGGIINDKIKQFMDGPAANRVPPAQRPTIEAYLRKCDPTTVRKFKDGSANIGSELDEAMAGVLKQFPVNPAFVRKFSDSNEVTGAGSGGGNGAGSERMKNTLRLCGLIPELAETGARLAKQAGINTAA